jgi:hypothetical protein
MATNKAKRSIHLAQPERRSATPQPAAEQMPVKARIYSAIAELNGGFEKTILSLKALQQISYFRTERLVSIHDLVCGIRAQANRECLGIVSERETANASHFEGLSQQREIKPPKTLSAG